MKELDAEGALKLACQHIAEGDYRGLLEPLAPRFITVEMGAKKGHWIIEFPFDEPDDVITCPGSVLISVELDGSVDAMTGL